MPILLSDKTRLLFNKNEIGNLADDVEVEFKIVNSGTKSDPRVIDCKIKFKISELKLRWGWESDIDWLTNGKHSWSKFPLWAEANIIEGSVGSVRANPINRANTVNLVRQNTIKRQGGVVRKQSDQKYDGPFDEYLKSLWPYLIKPQLLVNWQMLINDTFKKEEQSYYLVRSGLTSDVPACGCVYQKEKYTVITTDNEATVSAYEHFRINKVTKELELIKLLRQKAIVTGTIKPPDLATEMKEARKKINIPELGAGFPAHKKPYRFLKYSHILDAKLNYKDDCTDQQKFRAATLRTISPINVMLTHTAGGNVQFSHVHKINDQKPDNSDIGEDSSLRKFIVASMAKYLESEHESEAVFKEYFLLAQNPEYFEFIEKRNEILKEAKNIAVKITPVDTTKG